MSTEIAKPMTEEERIQRDIGIAYGDPWHVVIPRVLLWLEKRLPPPRAPATKQGGMCICGHHHNIHTINGHCDIYRMSHGKTACDCRDFCAE